MIIKFPTTQMPREHIYQITSINNLENVFVTNYDLDYYSINDVDTWRPSKIAMPDIHKLPITVITKRELMLEMIAYYYHNRDRCAVTETGACLYYDARTKNRCIIGRCIKDTMVMSKQALASGVIPILKGHYGDPITLGVHPLIVNTFSPHEASYMQVVHDWIGKSPLRGKVFDKELDKILSSINFTVFSPTKDAHMMLTVKAIKDHIDNFTPLWLPIHK